MTPENAKAASHLLKALADLPAVRRRLAAKPYKIYDAINLQLAAADMSDGFGQGSEAYIYVSADIGAKILEAAESIIRKAITDLGVQHG